MMILINTNAPTMLGGSERSREENAHDSGKGNKMFTEGSTIVGDVTKSPVDLLDAGDGVDGTEEIITTSGILNVCVDEERVRLRVDVFHHDLETVEATSLGGLDFVREAFDEVLVNYAVRCCEESENVGDEVSLVGVEAVVPIVQVL